MTVDERIEKLRCEMKKENIDIYYVPTSDYHETEYVGEFFKCRKYITGFTGSAGVAVITMDEAGLWTDGRYFVQAEKELCRTCVKLYKAGTEGTPTPLKYMAGKIDSGCIGFDGRVVNAGFEDKLKKELGVKNVSFRTELDLVGSIWDDRPEISHRPVREMGLEYAGRSRAEKLAIIRGAMDKEECDVHVLSTLDNICWLFNLRGDDVTHFPVMLSYAIITDKTAYLYVQKNTVDAVLEERLRNDGVIIRDYDAFYEELHAIKAGRGVLIDKSKVNLRIVSSLAKGSRVVDKQNPEVVPQSIKNETELENIRRAHIKDGIACTKFMYWLKKNIGRMPITEISAEKKLLELRQEQEGFLDVSFDTISAYGANAAMMHYSATEEDYAELRPEGMLLVDSGGHYLEGSTDITRTYVLGPLTDAEKKFYTAVLQGNLRLAAAKFIYGCRGVNLDILARGPVWELAADYRCGTGHGVGYNLNIHEAPNGFRWKIVEDRNDSCVLEAGQVTTNEPGYYEDGVFGIRTENEMVCLQGEKNEYGQFMYFETITYSPIDTEAIDMEMMTGRDIRLLNEYHKLVYDKLSPYFDGEELEFLKEATKEV